MVGRYRRRRDRQRRHRFDRLQRGPRPRPRRGGIARPFRRRPHEDLASWVSDRSLALSRELRRESEKLNKENLFGSGAHGTALALLKERALHEYRDQERQARRAVAVLFQTETWTHRFWRWKQSRQFPELTAHGRAQRALDIWRLPVRSHGGEPIEVVEPARRTLEETTTQVVAGVAGDFV